MVVIVGLLHQTEAAPLELGTSCVIVKDSDHGYLFFYGGYLFSYGFYRGSYLIIFTILLPLGWLCRVNLHFVLILREWCF